MKIHIIFLLLLPTLSFGQKESIDTLVVTKIDHKSNNSVHSILLFIDQPGSGDTFNKGFGTVDKGLQAVAANDQFRIASSTKLFVATIILQLIEEGNINLNDKAFKYLQEIEYLDFDNVHILNGKNYSNKITIKDLLSHRSGLADIFSDREEAFFGLLLKHPEEQYSPESIIELYFQFELSKEPHFIPNKGWRYSDMNYVLLGLIIEQLDNTSLAQSIRNRILEPLGMKDTYFEFYEDARGDGNMVNQYVGDINFTKLNTSFDWAGGGLVSTNNDLATFIQSLFNLELINKRSLSKITKVKYAGELENRYGLGIDESIYNGHTFYGHYGFYGTYVGFCPETGTTVSYAIGQATPDFNVYRFIDEIIQLIE